MQSNSLHYISRWQRIALKLLKYLYKPNSITSKNYLIFTSLFCLFLLNVSNLKAQVVINEVFPNGTVELKNIGTTTVDVSSYWLCDFPSYQQISNSNIQCGNMSMAAGEILTVDNFNVVAANDGEMGLYSSDSFGSSSAILDYVEWGSTGHQRSSVAVAAGIWTTGDFAPAFGTGESLAYDGDGDASSDWSALATPTICAENGGGCDVDAGQITTTDPTTICVDGNADPIDVAVAGAMGSNSGWIITDNVNNILALPMAPPFDLDGAGVGTCIIWYIRYENGLTGKDVGNNLSDLDGCFDLSNGITVYRQAPDGGVVTLTDGSTSYANCAGNIVFDVTHTTAADMLSYWYIITDDNDNILAYLNSADGNTLDLSAAPAGTCRVWGWSYRGEPIPVVGNNISTLSDGDCEDVSDDFITVYREVPDGGTVTLLDGSTTYAACPGNVVFDVTHTTSAPNLSYWYIITDDSDNILAYLNSADGNTLDLSAAPAGTCRVWGWNYKGEPGPVMGENISILSDGDCEDVSDGFITVYREVPDGGTVTLTDGSTSYANCAGNIVFDVMHTTTATNLSYWYIITDDSDNILAFLNSADGNTLDLSAAPAGTCRVWGWNYKGEPTPVVGENISTLSDGDCEDVSDDFITVYREVPDGGTVNSDFGTETTICVDGIPDPITVSHVTTAPNLSYWYIITDDQNTILATTTSNVIDLDGAGVGTCRIWGWNYKGEPTPVIGDDISSLADGDCEDISDNFIVVNRVSGTDCDDICIVDGGTISTNDDTVICVDGNPDPIDVTVAGAIGTNGGWIITDNLNNILALPMAPPFDLDGAGVGTCIIWYIRYEDGLTGKEMGNNLSDLNGCFNLSNGITVYRQAPDGGAVTLLDGSTSYAACPGNVIFDVTHSTTADMLSYWYIITDDNDNILAYLNSADGNTLDLSAAPAGTCRVWGWSYRGEPTPIMGDPISTLNDGDCETISDDFITVYREVPDGGAVTLLDGSTSYAACPGNVIFDVTHSTTAPNLSYWYIVTDDSDNILAFLNSADGNTLDLSVAPAGTCRVWGWNYKGEPLPVVGENISTLSDGDCEDTSDDFITVYREVPDGGAVTLLDGSTSYAACPGNVIFDVTHTTAAPNLSYWYIVTDDSDNILAFLNSADGNTLDLSVAPAGTCRVWGWNYKGEPLPVVGENISTLSDGDCEDISDDFITVYREVPDGGAVTLLDGSTSYAACAGNVIFDVTHTTAAPNLSYWYIVTDDSDNILAFLNSADGNTLDLSVAPAGTCRVWGWNYRGEPTPVVGENISTLSDGDCEDISDDFITVYREVADGGTVDSDLGTSITICIDDEPDPITLSHVTSAPNLNYWYIITDDNDVILDWSTNPVIDLNGAGVGTCRIWGWNYRGEPNPVMGDPLSTLDDGDCESVSASFIEVVRIDQGAPCITSTDDLGSVSYLNVYPNPTKDFVQIEYKGLESRSGKLQLVDITGSILREITLEQQDDNIQMDVSALHAGFYFVHIINKDLETAARLIITK